MIGHMGFNFINIGGINRKSVGFFGSSSINFSVLGFPVSEGIIDI